MQIIIPMSGFGERFRRAGYSIPKPLIEIDEKPIIAHIIDMFPGEQNFFFICNQDHLNHHSYYMEAILRQYCPTGQIIGISPHKLGPIHAVQQVEHLIDFNSPTIVNYCDFSCYWNWDHFKKFISQIACLGAIPAYKGFHPHTLGNTSYAYMREINGWVQDIQEKQAYTNNRMEEFASSGTYYFASGKIMSEAFKIVKEQRLDVNGEYYVSLAYKPLLAKNLPIAVYPLQHFMQWGTPEDVAEYNSWSKAFKRLAKVQNKALKIKGSLVIPMAGLGQRFINEGYSISKPLLSVSGKPMIMQAIASLPPATYHAFIIRDSMHGYQEIAAKLKQAYPKAIIKTIPSLTKGQACTALLGLETLEQQIIRDSLDPITFAACDNGVLYNFQNFQRLISNSNIDIIVWGIRGHAQAIRHPNMFGWIKAKAGQIQSISVKTPLNSPATDPIVLGTFTFRRAKDFYQVVQRLKQREGYINGEFYIDSCINDAIELGLRCYLFEVDSFLSWGTPDDLRTFEYWQSCFHKWKSHPYKLQLDSRIPQNSIEALLEKYKEIKPNIPAN